VPKNEALVRQFGVFKTRAEAEAREQALIAQYGRKGLDPGGTLLNRTLGGGGKAGYHIQSAAVSARNLEQLQIGANAVGVSLERYQALSLPERKALQRWVRRNPGANGNDWLEMRENAQYRSAAASKGRQQAASDAASKYQISKEKWEGFDLATKARIASRYKAGVRGEALLAPANSVAPLVAVEAAAKYGVTVEQWQAASTAARELAKARYSRGIRGDSLWAPPGAEYSKAVIAAAKKYGIDPARWAKLSAKERMRVSGRWLRGIREFAALFEGLI
jgi:hypothetical protein